MTFKRGSSSCLTFKLEISHHWFRQWCTLSKLSVNSVLCQMFLQTQQHSADVLVLLHVVMLLNPPVLWKLQGFSERCLSSWPRRADSDTPQNFTAYHLGRARSRQPPRCLRIPLLYSTKHAKTQSIFHVALALFTCFCKVLQIGHTWLDPCWFCSCCLKKEAGKANWSADLTACS